MKQTILAIAGRPGLYKLLTRGKNSLIVESLDAAHKRQPTFANDRITSLGDIAMFTNGDDVPLTQVLENLKTLESGKKSSLNIKTANGDQLREYFSKVLPDFDRDRVHTSDIKKLIQWYNILIENEITDFVDEKPAEEKPAEEKAAEEAPAVEEAPVAEEKPAEKKEAEAPKKKPAEKKEAPKEAEAPKKKSSKK